MRFLFSLLFLAMPSVLLAKAPAAPSNLRLTAVGVNAFFLEWKDNAKNESGFEIWLSLGKADPEKFQVIATPNATSHLVILPNGIEYPGQTVNAQMLAYNGATGAEKRSKLTAIVSAKTPAASKFDAPVKLKAVALDDASIRLKWEDRATSEQGYEIQCRQKGAAKWKSLGTIRAEATYRPIVGELKEKQEYEFQVRAFKNSGGLLTAFSNTASATTKRFQAPTKLSVHDEGDGTFRFQWKDHSGLEAGYIIEVKKGDGKFDTLGEVGASITRPEAIAGFELKTPYSFRVKAFRNGKKARVYSGYSNVFKIRSQSLRKPSGFKLAKIERNSAKLVWKDESRLETGYEVQYRRAGTKKFTTLGTTAADAQSLETQDLEPGKVYEFRVRARNATARSPWSLLVKGTTQDGITSELAPEIFLGTSFHYEIGVSRASKLASLSVGMLPAGLRYQASTRSIMGTPTSDKLVSSTVTARFKDGTKDVRKLVFRIVRAPAPPVSTAPFRAVSLTVGNHAEIPLAGKFADPDSVSARRVTTTMGVMDIILYSEATPATVKNFLNYAESGKYDSSFFHRSVANFVIQGGGYGTDGTSYSKVITAAAVKNEPGVSNQAGTVAMAKLGGNPDSATSQWFVNVADNSANLDFQNGGFTVFGRVTAPGLAVARAINDLPVGDYSFPVGAGGERLEDVPVNATNPPITPDPTTLVKILSVAPVAPLRYIVASSNEAVATAVIEGGSVRVNGTGAGSATITVKAIDLDGEEISRGFNVQVSGL